MNEACKDDDDCNHMKYAVCSKDKVCVCDENHIEYNKEFCKSGINGFCSSSADCLAVNSTCIDHKCQCKPEMVKYTKDLCITRKFCNIYLSIYEYSTMNVSYNSTIIKFQI